MHWLVKIINGEPDDFVHAKFVKYGMGDHPGPSLKLTLSKARIAFKGDLDMEKGLVKGYAISGPEGTHKVKGLIVTYSDRQSEFEGQPVPLSWRKTKGKSASTYKAKLDERVPIGDLKAMVSVDDPTTFFLLSLSPTSEEKPWKIATKTSFPKAKQDSKGTDKKEKDPVFVKGAFANTPEMLEYILNQFLPDFRDKLGPKAKSIVLKHRIIIEDIEIPDDPTLTFSEKRKLAKKRGRLIRSVSIDGEELTKEYAFLA